MSESIGGFQPPLSDPESIPERFSTGADIHVFPEYVELVFWTQRSITDDGHRVEHVITGRHPMPRSRARDLAEQLWHLLRRDAH